MTEDFKFRAFDKASKSCIKISSLNFDDSGLVQLSGFTKSGKLIHVSISQVELKITSDSVDKLKDRLDNGRDYLMQVEMGQLTVIGALDAFGFNELGYDKR